MISCLVFNKEFDIQNFMTIGGSPCIYLRGLPTLDAEKKAIFMNFFCEVYIIDIDMKIVRLSKYTLRIHK